MTAGGTALEGAAVHVFDSVTNAYFATTVTDAGGAYTFSLPAGTYKLFVQPDKPGLPRPVARRPGLRRAPTPITLGPDMTGVTIALVAARHLHPERHRHRRRAPASRGPPSTPSTRSPTPTSRRA